MSLSWNLHILAFVPQTESDQAPFGNTQYVTSSFTFGRIPSVLVDSAIRTGAG